MMNNKKISPTIICPNCKYENVSEAKKCSICQQDLNVSRAENTDLVRDSSTITNRNLEKFNRRKRQLKGVILGLCRYCQVKSQKLTIIAFSIPTKKKLKPIDLVGIVMLLSGFFLFSSVVSQQDFRKWTDFTEKHDDSPNEEKAAGIELVDSIEAVKNVPEGVFHYSGDGYFAALLSNGLKETILKTFPNLEINYITPSNQNPSHSVAIEMLIEGEVDFIFSGRALNPSEIARAELENINLTAHAIAVDGIIFFYSQNAGVSRLTLEQLQDIYRGKIVNWRQLGGADRQIVPVILSPENLSALGFEINEKLVDFKYEPNDTLAIRRTIETEGSFGYASAALVNNQSLLDFFALGQPDYRDSTKLDFIEPDREAFASNLYPMTRRLFVIHSDRNRSSAIGKAIASMILSDRGQEIVEESGFVRIR